MRRISLYVVLAILAAKPLRAQDSAVVERLYSTAVAAGTSGDLRTAISAMDSVVQLDSLIPDAYWNLGLWQSAAARPTEALSAWQRYRQLQPGDWHVRAKLIQAHQALGDTVGRNLERDALLALRATKKDKALARVREYCREQFRVGSTAVMAFETFEPKGDRRVFLTFYVMDSTGKSLGHFSLGSYDVTTAVARSTGSIGPKDRMYHLDWYEGNAHATFGFYRGTTGV